MPIGDYGNAVFALPVAAGLRVRLRAWWSRLFNRGEDSVEGRKFESLK